MARARSTDLPLGVAQTVHRSPSQTGSDGVRRAARVRLDHVSEDYPGDGAEPTYAHVNLLQPPRDSQPVVWASGGDNILRLYRSEEMRVGGIAFVITGLVYED